MSFEPSVTKTATATSEKIDESVSNPERSRVPVENSPVERFLNLQRTVGNQAVQVLLQKKVQAKLVVSQQGDVCEQEAERISDTVMSLKNRTSSKQGIRVKPEPLWKTPRNVAFGKESSFCADNLLGMGQPMPRSTSEFFENRFGYDFSGVSIRTDYSAAEAAEKMNAQAFTVDKTIVFNSGYYNPETLAGQKLLAHELTHVVQQDKAGGMRKLARGVQRQALSQSQTKNLGIGEQKDERRFTIITESGEQKDLGKDEAVKALRQVATRLKINLSGDRAGHSAMIEIRNDQPIVGFFSDVLGGVKMPSYLIWLDPMMHEYEAEKALAEENIDLAIEKLTAASAEYNKAHKEFVRYRDGTISGAETSIKVLKGTAAVGAAAATIATGGIAAEAGIGILGTSALTAAVGGGYGMAQETGGQIAEIEAGLRKSIEMSTILRRGATDAVTNFVATLTGGVLSRYATRLFGSYLGNLSEEMLTQLGKDLGMAGPLPRDFFLTQGQRFIAEFIGNVGSTPLTTAVKVVVTKITGGAPIPSPEEFTHMVIDEMVQAGAIQLFLGGLTHGYASVRSTRATAEPVTTPLTAAHEPALPAPKAEPSTALAISKPPARPPAEAVAKPEPKIEPAAKAPPKEIVSARAETKLLAEGTETSQKAIVEAAKSKSASTKRVSGEPKEALGAKEPTAKLEAKADASQAKGVTSLKEISEAAARLRFWRMLSYLEGKIRGNGIATKRWNRSLKSFPKSEHQAIEDHLNNVLNGLPKGDRGTLYNWSFQKNEAGKVLAGKAVPGYEAGHMAGGKMVSSGFQKSPSFGTKDPRNFSAQSASQNASKGAGIEEQVTQKYTDLRNKGVPYEEARRQATEEVTGISSKTPEPPEGSELDLEE